MKIYDKVEQLIGNTPILRANNLKKELNLKANILLKLENLNPAGSVKDRAALGMLNRAEKDGVIKAGGTIIEPTSGNTGIGLALVGISRGYKVILTMPDTMSVERINLLKAYGAQVELTDGTLGMSGAIKKAEELNDKIPNSVIIGQFDNSANPEVHYLTTAPEIYNDTDGNIDYLVAGVGSGGTISGVGKYLKEQNSLIKIIAVEPKSSPLITNGISGAHQIQGIGANFIPKNLDLSVIDEVKLSSDEDAFKSARLLVKTEGVFAGISSGAALNVAIDIARKQENEGKNIVVIIPDSGDRYLSTKLYSE